MPAKRTRDHQDDLATHLECNRRAQEWCVKAIQYREAGELAKCKEAERKAKRWLLKCIQIEGRYPTPSREATLREVGKFKKG